MNCPTPTAPTAPGLIITLGETAPVERVVDRHLATLRAIRPDVVMLHTYPGPEDAPTIAKVRAAIPGVRIWIQAPANTLAGGSESNAIARAEEWARDAAALGVEALILNGEMSSGGDPPRPGWDAKTPAEVTAKVTAKSKRLRAIFDAMAAVPGCPVLGWSSHDRIERLSRSVWRAALGPGSPVKLHLPQTYSAPPNRAGVTKRASTRARLKAHAKSFAAGVPADVRADLVQGGVGWIPYGQAHHHETAATCTLLDAAPIAALWTLSEDRESSDPAGVLAARADAELRRRVGHGPGRVARFQASAGLKADGVVGPATLAALGFAS